MPRLRAREQAAALGISEAELTALDLGDGVVRLRDDFKALLTRLEPLGKLMALTRNDAVVHERKGVYSNVSFFDGHAEMGLVVNPDIDLRLFLSRWTYGLAVTTDRGPERPRLYSFQFFDAYGVAVHKIHSTPETDVAAYEALAADFAAAEQDTIELAERTPPEKSEETPDHEVDVAGFRESWLALKDTHDFFPMLRYYEVSRPQALRLAPAGRVTEVSCRSVEHVLERARQAETPLMCFVHSPGCIQIHTGPVRTLAWYGDWYNVMDPDFNLHLDTGAIARAFVVRKPTADGVVTSLELFDADGELIVYFFGARKPGVPELAAWTGLLEGLPGLKTSKT